jgi:VWFA-related protein
MASLLYSCRSDSNHNQGEAVFKMRRCGVHKKVSESQIIIIRLLALFVFAAAVPWACGQAATQPVSPGVESPQNADQVYLNLVVTDKNDKRVLDLKPGEIAVTDGNSPVTLKDLSLVTGKQNSDHLITLVFDRPSPAAGSSKETDPSITKIARDTAAKILKIIPASGFSISVLNVDRQLWLQSGFTSDRKVLEEAVHAATEPLKSGSGSTVSPQEQQQIALAMTGVDSSGKAINARDRSLAQALHSALKNSSRIAQDQHLRPSLAALLALAQAEQPLAQRKAVIYFTSLQDRQVDSEARNAIKSIIGSAELSRVILYVVDLGSLDRTGARISAQGMLHASNSQESSDKESNNNDMQQLAEGTGGSYITGNGMQRSLEGMIQDLTTYYEAFYSSPPTEFDGKFHPIAVKSLRPGLTIRTQTGYFALPPRDAGGAAPEPFELPLLKILGAAQLPNDLAFRAAILRMGDRPEGNVNTLAIEVPYSNLEIREDPNTNVDSVNLSIVADIKDKTGTVVERFSSNIPRRGILKNNEKIKNGVVTFQRHFTALVGQYVLEAAILDHNSGKAGAQRIAFEIPSASGVPSLSNMVLVRQTDPVHAGDDPQEPLRYENNKLTPNLSGQLPPGVKDVSVFFTAHSDLSAPGAPTLSIQVFRDGKALGGAPMINRQTSGAEYSSYLTSFSVNPPMDGLYEVKASLSQGGKTAETGVTFTMAGTSADADPSLPDHSSHPVGPLVITFPTNPMQKPSPDELKSILLDTTTYAMEYRDSLPNLMCEQVTNRSVNQKGTSQWIHKDKFTELLSYVNHDEDRIMLELELNGSKSHDYTGDTRGVLSVGEFGAAISGLFRPTSMADFQWKETGALGDGTVQVFDYRVELKNSSFHLRMSPTDVVTAGYHGQVFIDSSTRAVRRITQVVDDVPRKFPFKAASVSVDYDYVLINKHDYLLPVGAQIILKKGSGESDMNDIEFRNFHRFGSTMKILNYSPLADPADSPASKASHKKHGNAPSTDH